MTKAMMTRALALTVLSWIVTGCSNVTFEALPATVNAKMDLPPPGDDLVITEPVVIDPTPTPEPPVVIQPTPQPTATPDIVVIQPTPIPTATPVVVVNPSATPSPTPVVVVIQPTPTPVPPTPAPTKTAGTCLKGQAISSCLACDYSVPTPPPWQPSTKAEKLAQIQYLSCPIQNKSDSPYKRIITQLEAVSKIQACSAALYPETAMSSAQAATIDALLGTDSSMRTKLYGGLYYQPPYSDHFEQYFGVYHADIRRVFCDGEDPATVLAAPLFTKEYSDYCYGQNMCDPSMWPKAARDRWNAVQAIRNQLRSCMTASASLPALTRLPGEPDPATQTKKCSWKKFDGLYELGGQAELDSMLNQGYTVSLETGNSCSLINSSNGLTGMVQLTGFKCQ
jgi:hypothetical protein